MTIHRSVPLMLAVLAAACSSSPTGGAPRLAFEAGPDPRDYRLEAPQVSVEATSGGVRLEALTTEPEGCRALDGELRVSGRTLRMTVKLEPIPTFVQCGAGPANYAYRAQVTGLSGEYRLQVVHVYPDGSHPTRDAADVRVRVDRDARG